MKYIRPQREDREETIYQLLEDYKHAREAAMLCNNTLDAIITDIVDLYAVRIQSALSEKKEPFGEVAFEVGDEFISFRVPKRVFWDQDGLKEMLAEGAPVESEYTVDEKAFSELDDAGKKAFKPYRTVRAGAIEFKIVKQNE